MPDVIEVYCDDKRHRGGEVTVRRFERRTDSDMSLPRLDLALDDHPIRWVQVRRRRRPKGPPAPGRLVLGWPGYGIERLPLPERGGTEAEMWEAHNLMRTIQPLQCRGCRKAKDATYRKPHSIIVNSTTLDPIFEAMHSIGRDRISLDELDRALSSIE